MKKSIIILIIFSIFACNEKQDQIDISDEFKLQFLNEVLSDTLDLQILQSKTQPISNFGSGYMVPPNSSYIIKNDTIKEVSYNQFIAEHLNIKDTAYVVLQRKENLKLNLDQLSKFGFNVFDLKGYAKKNVPHDSIMEMIDSLNNGTDNYSIVKFTKPIFNKDKSLAYIRFSQGGSGNALILEKIKGKWKEKIHVEMWAE